jgi:hypothetical protein
MHVLAASYLSLVIGNLLDVVSTVLGMAYVPGAIESNPLMRDPNTLKFVFWQGIAIKSMGILLFAAPLTALIYISTRNALLSVIHVWWMTYVIMQVWAKNMIYVVMTQAF